ncbi:MAG: type II toxin-antitoxin system RelE/ParE family toxin [Burkholderiales bacterium]
MIRSFLDKPTAAIFQGKPVLSLPRPMQKVALRKLLQLDAARDIADMRVPPGNRLEQLKGKRAGQWSIRINDQWRICFKWDGKDAHEVEIADYH